MRTFLLLAFTYFSTIAFGQNWPITGGVSGAQDYVQMISNDPEDAVYISFEDTRGNNSIDIFVQKMSLSGSPLWTFGGVPVCDTTGSQETQRIVTDGADGCIIVWADSRGGSGQWDIYAQRLNPGGNKLWGMQGKPVCVAPGTQREPEITSDFTGGVYVIWEDKRGANWDIYVQRLSSNGNPVTGWPTDGILISQANSNKDDLAIDQDGSGGAFIAWTDNRTNWNIYCTRVLPTGVIASGFPPDGLLICDNSSTQDQTVLAYTGQGDCIVAWKDQSYSGGAYAVFANRVRENGTIPTSWDSNGIFIVAEIQNGSNRQAQYPEIIADGCGGAIISGESSYSNNDNDVSAQRVDSSGNLLWTSSWTGHLQISYSVNNDRNVKIAPDGDAGFFATWRMNQSGTGADIMMKWFDKNGNQRNYWTICNQSNSQDNPAIVRVRNCAYVAWEDNRPGSAGMDIYGEDTCHICFSANIVDTINDETCTPGGDGEIGIQVFVMTKKYEILWGNGDTTLFRDSLLSGPYTVTVTDGYGCETTDSFFVGGLTPTGLVGQWLWDGVFSGDWFEPCNWDKIAIPDTSSAVVIPGTTLFQPMIAGDTAHCRNLTLNVSNGGQLLIEVSSSGYLIKNP